MSGRTGPTSGAADAPGAQRARRFGFRKRAMKPIPAWGPDAFRDLGRCLAAALALGAGLAFGGPGANPAAADGGIRFICSPARLAKIPSDMAAYLAELGIAPAWVVGERSAGRLRYALHASLDDGDTLGLHARPELAISDDVVTLPAPRGRWRRQATVSKKEILLALLQRGRVTEFSGGDCSLAALREHVAVRQNIVAWAERLNWHWPDGEAAQWNRKYWQDGTLRPGFALHEAVNDAFMHQEKYSLGCYTGAKLVMLQGVLDYYGRIKQDFRLVGRIEARLLADREPLVDVEPARMWDFEPGFDRRRGDRPGKLLRLLSGVAARNFVPGDWVHVMNTDRVSYRITGYEGSNPIYLGRNRFNDYYNDHGRAYSYREKLDEVFQWRHSVFNTQRDAARIQPLSAREIERLGATPAAGGLVIDKRIFPQYFNADQRSAL